MWDSERNGIKPGGIQYYERTDWQLSDENVWVHERLREIASLDGIIARLTSDAADGQTAPSAAVAGAGRMRTRSLAADRLTAPRTDRVAVGLGWAYEALATASMSL